jgi:lysophospholipid acyltransferase (LPLAT)-like uncharacterized protein
MAIRVPDRVAKLGGGAVLWLLTRSWRMECRHRERWEQVARGGERFIYLAWHEALLPLLWHHRGERVAIIVSSGREGRYLGDYASGLGYRLLTGSTTRGGPRAMRGAIRALQGGEAIAVTPDGPRGPRREIKPGAIRMAQREGAWDRFMVPRFATKVVVGYGEPFRVGPGADELAAATRRCSDALTGLEASLGREEQGVPER